MLIVSLIALLEVIRLFLNIALLGVVGGGSCVWLRIRDSGRAWVVDPPSVCRGVCLGLFLGLFCCLGGFFGLFWCCFATV